jgi:3-hydroxyacyl-[acyl-carrier-protein] dehydratase
MRFTLLDRIVQFEPGARITAVKTLTLAEEYLADHFPMFPVMPGVLMLEAMTQAGAWLVRASEDFANSMVVLKAAHNVKYSNFVAPGQTLTVTAEITHQDAHDTKIKAQGSVNGEVQLSGRLVLVRYGLAEKGLGSPEADDHVKRELRKLFALLYRPPASRPTDAAVPPAGGLHQAAPEVMG